MNENVTVGSHGWHDCTKFIKWGLRFFLLGLLFGFGVLIHYLMGSSYNTTSEFLGNITLWFGSPLSLSVTYLQLGGLAMAVFGLAKLLVLKCKGDSAACCSTASNASYCTDHGCGTLSACNFGLILLFIVGYIGYFVIDAIWPGFYYTPITNAKNIWLILQGVSILIFFFGFVTAFYSLCKHCCTKKTTI